MRPFHTFTWPVIDHYWKIQVLVIFSLYFLRMVSSLAFYGLGLNVGSLGGSVYINFLLSGVMEFLAYVFCMCLVDRVGRRPLNCGLMLLAGVACTLTILPVLYASSCEWFETCLAVVCAICVFIIIHAVSNNTDERSAIHVIMQAQVACQAINKTTAIQPVIETAINKPIDIQLVILETTVNKL